MKALIVDDAQFMRNMIQRILSEEGFEHFVEAETGEQALQMVQEETFSVILMDWNMPGMSGLEAIQHIRALGNTTPIIMVTTEAQKQRVVEAIRAGAQNYVVKPFMPDELSKKVKQAIK